jgi:two-component system chemotaxis sensor kinase CheA
MSDAEIVKEFLVESYENLDRLDQELVVLEKDPGNRDILADIFRTIHTIKGTSGFLGFKQLEALAHAGENLLARLRDGLLMLSPEITTTLLAMVDRVRQMLGSIDATGKEEEGNDQDLIATLTRLQQDQKEAAPLPAPPARDETQQKSTAQTLPKLGDILIGLGAVEASAVQEAVAQQKAGDQRQVGEILIGKGVINAQDVADALYFQQLARGQGAGESTIRVDVEQLERLMDRVGELVLLRNQIAQYVNSIEDSELLGTSQRLNLLTSELQEGVMKTRMQPVGNIWGRFPRTVRDVALGCGKQVRIAMEGKETELDKTIIEAVKDPLTHLVRNAVDHGIESPETRRAAGKNPEGLLFLRAFHEGGQVHIEVSDDGAGLDYERIRAKAMQQGLITADQAARMDEREIASLVFLPGFTTAEKVTNVSGRGVGLDVVKTNLESIGGTVAVQSKPGQGTTLRMKIPLTLTIIPALMVTAAGDRYAIPQASLVELVHLEGEQASKSIERVHGAPVYRLRGRLLPLVCLKQELRIDDKAQDGRFPQITASSGAQPQNIVVLRADDRQFGLVVDDISDSEEIVVKPLSKQLKSADVYTGVTIRGDGQVVLILNVRALAQRANVLAPTRDPALAGKEGKQFPGDGSANQRNAVLLFQYGEDKRMAVDLALVTRLEEFPCHSIETAGDREVVQYRGQITPLLRAQEVLGSGHRPALGKGEESLHVVMFSDKGRSVGLVVDHILDIVEESFVLQQQSARRGVLGSAVIQKRVTDILDVPGLIAAAGGGQWRAEAQG